MARTRQITTKEYQLRAANNYKDKHDRIQITLDLGEKKRLAAVGLDVSTIRELIRAEYKRRIGATDITPQQEPEPQPEMIEQPEAQTTPEPQPEEKPFMPRPTQKTSMDFFD